MKAAFSREYGPLSSIIFEQTDMPVLKAGEVLIKIAYSSVNRTDCGFRAGEPKLARIIMGFPRPRFPIMGCEFAGTITEIAKDVSAYKVGDRVFGYSEDDYGFGGHAEFKAMAVKGMLAHIPEGLEFADCVAATEGGHYALNCLRAGKITSGSRVLINGATGAIGSAAVQLCRQRGAIVTAVCAGAHFETIKTLGASQLVDYETQDFTQVLSRQEFDVILDAVGKSTFGACRALLTPLGIYMSTELGPKAQNPFLALWTKLFGKQRVMFPFPHILQSDIMFLKQLLQTGEFKPLVDRTYDFDDLIEAYHYVETGEKIGNVLIRIQDS